MFACRERGKIMCAPAGVTTFKRTTSRIRHINTVRTRSEMKPASCHVCIKVIE